jgi:hypothetical protein
VKDAILELRVRRANGRKNLGLRETAILTEDPDLVAIGERVVGVYASSAFDHLINRKIERRLALCEARVISPSS